MKLFNDTIFRRGPVASLPGNLAITVFIALSTNSNYAIARPCLPSDPTGSNLGNLCPQHLPSYLNTHTNILVPGSAIEGYYGTPINPIYPGTPLNPTSPKDGFFTTINAINGSTTIRTNTGKEWNFGTN
jgi:hypothetical protein